MSIWKLCIKIGIYNKKLTNFKREIQHMKNFLKDDCLLVVFHESYLTRMRSLKSTGQNRPYIGLKSIHGNAHPPDMDATDTATPPFEESGVGIVSHPPTSISTAPSIRIQTARNMAQFEQLVDRLNVAPCGLPSNQ